MGKNKAYRTKDWGYFYSEQAKSNSNTALQKFYETGLPDPNTPLDQVPFVAMDFETTGLDPEVDEIISIGLVPFSLQRIFCRHSQHWLVKPEPEQLSESSVTIHGITHANVDAAPELLEILADILEALAGRVVVVHYRFIESEFLDRALISRLGAGLQFPVIDTMQIEADLRASKSESWFSHFRKVQLPSVRLADTRLRYHLPAYQNHHALTDAIATAELFQAQVAHHFRADLSVGDLWL